MVQARSGLRLPGVWSDEAADMASDRLEDDGLQARAEQWRPWRAYGALYGTRTKEQYDGQTA